MSGKLRAAGLWGPVALYMAAIVYVSHLPNLMPPAESPDWAMHVAEYAGLAFLMARAVSPDRGPFLRRRAAAAAAACLVFAVSDEIHQLFVAGRSASVRDFTFDAVGVALGMGLWPLVRKRRSTARHEVVLLGRNACHLCDEAERVMRPVLHEMGLPMSKVDVDDDERLARLYGHEIPVVLIDGRKAFKHRVDPDRLRRRLAGTDRGRER